MIEVETNRKSSFPPSKTSKFFSFSKFLKMNSVKGKGKKNLLLKTWDRCRSIPREKSPSSKPSNTIFSNSKSWHTSTTRKPSPPKKETKKCQVAPEGCFSVYVGPERQRFVVKTKYASHPLFKMLLEDAEREYGYNCDGQLLIPCEVDLFYRVLAEMDGKKEEDEKVVPSCGFVYGSCSPFNPARRLGGGGNGNMGKDYGSYAMLTPSRLLKMNTF